MKTYKEKQITTKIVDKILCNSCGKEIFTENYEEYFHGEILWSYSSNNDNREDEFDLCCDCYDEITNKFKIPVYK